LRERIAFFPPPFTLHHQCPQPQPPPEACLQPETVAVRAMVAMNKARISLRIGIPLQLQDLSSRSYSGRLLLVVFCDTTKSRTSIGEFLGLY
jgi:hypothetical protein